MQELSDKCRLAGWILKPLQVEGDVVSEKDLKTSLTGVHGWLVGRETVNEDVLAFADQLRCVVKYGVGLDNIDFTACHAANVEIHHSPGVNARYVAELTLGLMISSFRNISKSARLISQGIWQKNGGLSLFNKTVGIVGCGHVGSAFIELIQPFSCRVLVCDLVSKQEILESYGATQIDFRSLLTECDVVSLHVPLTDKTRKMMGQSEFELMKSTAFLINTSRGAVVDHEALVHALETRQIAGAAMDVFETEPLNDRRLSDSLNFTGTPHIAGNSREAVEAMGRAAMKALFN